MSLWNICEIRVWGTIVLLNFSSYYRLYKYSTLQIFWGLFGKGLIIETLWKFELLGSVSNPLGSSQKALAKTLFPKVYFITHLNAEKLWKMQICFDISQGSSTPNGLTHCIVILCPQGSNWQYNSIGSGGRFKNTYELLNLRALKISKLHKNHIFQCMGKIFCVEFQRVPLKFHTKYLTHTLKDVDFIHIWKFKSSLI